MCMDVPKRQPPIGAAGCAEGFGLRPDLFNRHPRAPIGREHGCAETLTTDRCGGMRAAGWMLGAARGRPTARRGNSPPFPERGVATGSLSSQ
jgi:hypothetical protein